MPSLQPLLDARYGAGAPALRGDAGPVLETLLRHRSVRAFTAEPVGDDVLLQLVAAAQSASSSSNLQAWSVVAVRDPERRARLAAFAGGQRHVVQAPLFLAWISDLSRLSRIAGSLGQPCGGLDYVESLLLGTIDAALAAQNAAAAAESMGLGVVYIGALRNEPEKVAAELSLPPRAFAVFGMCVGRPDPERPAAVKPRLPQEGVLHRETYGVGAEPAALASYDREMTGFYASQGMRAEGWIRHTAARIRDAASLTGRDRLKPALHALGFKLD